MMDCPPMVASLEPSDLTALAHQIQGAQMLMKVAQPLLW